MGRIDILESKVRDLEERLSKIESAGKEKSGRSPIIAREKSIPDEVLRLISPKIDDIKTSSLIAIVLKFYGDLTKEKQIQILKKLGKKEAESLRGGNYTRDVVNRGLVHDVGKIGRDIVYSLTEKGKIEVENILKRLKGETIGKK